LKQEKLDWEISYVNCGGGEDCTWQRSETVDPPDATFVWCCRPTARGRPRSLPSVKFEGKWNNL